MGAAGSPRPGVLFDAVLNCFFADDATLGLAPPDAVPQDNLAVLLSTPLRIRMKLLVLKLSPCNEEKEKGDFTR